MNIRHALRWSTLLVAVSWGGSAVGDTVEVDFNDESFRAAYTQVSEEKGLEFDFGWLHHSDNGDVGFVGMHVLDLGGSGGSPIEAGVGGKVFLTDTDFDNGIAVGLGGYLRYRFPRQERLELGGRLYYAPDVLGFSGTEKYLEAGIQASYLVHERAAVVLGVRKVEVKSENAPTVDVNEGLHVGVRLSF